MAEPTKQAEKSPEKPAEKAVDKPADKGPENKWAALVVAASTVAEKFGISTAFLVLLLAVIWLFGSTETRDDFLRALLFQGFKRKEGAEFAGWSVTIMFGLLAAASIAEWAVGRWWKGREGDEMKRLAAENVKLQNRLLAMQNEQAKASPAQLSAGSSVPATVTPQPPEVAEVPRDNGAQTRQDGGTTPSEPAP